MHLYCSIKVDDTNFETNIYDLGSQTLVFSYFIFYIFMNSLDVF